MNALPKMIDDRDVRTKDIRAFLEKDFPPESLPTVDEARALVAQHRQVREDFSRGQRDAAPLEKLKAMQTVRREEAVAERTALDVRHASERGTLEGTHRQERRALKAGYLAELRRVKEARDKARPTGLAAFLGKVTGVNLLVRKVQKHRDAKRYAAHADARDALRQRQSAASNVLARRHQLQVLDADGALRALDQVDARERKSLETQQTRTERVKRRDGSERMPALTLELKPRGRRAVPHKAMNRFRKGEFAKSEPPKDFRRSDTDAPERGQSVRGEFSRAVEDRDGETRDEQGGDATGATTGGNRTSRTERPDVAVETPTFRSPVPTHEWNATDPHWTELPLSDTFDRVAREPGTEVEDDAGEYSIRPSRASRPSERGVEKGRAREDFERER